MEIRQATEADYDGIYMLVEAAFKVAEMPPENEQEFVLNLRKRDSFIPELELVAEDDGELVGHVMLTKQEVKMSRGECRGLLLAPLCVSPEYRNKGIGAELTYAVIEKARELGYTAVFLVGYPKYYQKLGFREVGELGIENKTGIPDEFVMGREIVEEGLADVEGLVEKME